MDKRIEKYINEFCDEEDPILKELDLETHRKILMPRMLSGKIQGKILEMISKMIKPESILELGTYTGYSAICMAKGLAEGGLLTTIEIDEELEWISKKYFEKSGNQFKIKQLIGDALQIIPTLDTEFDLVFMDADKRVYLDYYQAVLPKVKKGGFILADNVLWNNKVIEKAQPNDTYTKGILKFNDFIKTDDRVEKVIFPYRDGIFLIRKK